ncbi:MAG: hypothetical protein WDN69_22375 [Aliidongia sp.]
MPEVAIDLIDRPTEVPWGGGEPSAAIVPAAIGNAVFDATRRTPALGAVHAGPGQAAVRDGISKGVRAADGSCAGSR